MPREKWWAPPVHLVCTPRTPPVQTSRARLDGNAAAAHHGVRGWIAEDQRVKIGYVMSEGRGDVDLVMARFAGALMARGVAVAGVVQTNTECGEDRPCDMDVRVLPDGPVLRISQDLGPGSRGCRLDAAALEQAVGLVAARLSGDTRLLIVNKFGKQESEGGGFRNLIGTALAEGIPVLVGLNGLNRAAFAGFAGDMADPVAPDPEALMAWFSHLAVA